MGQFIRKFKYNYTIFSYMPYDFREDLVSYILSRMEGSNELDSKVKTQPSKRFILGPLAADMVDDVKHAPANDLNPDKASIRATRLRTSILVDNTELDKKPEFSILVKGYVFYKIRSDEVNDGPENPLEDDNLGEEHNKYLWVRKEFQLPISMQINSNKSDYSTYLDFSEIVSSCNSDDLIYKKILPDTWKAEVSVSIKKYEDNKSIVHFYLSNTAIYDYNKDRDVEKTLFNCKMRVDLHNLTTSKFLEQYNYNGHKQQYLYDFRTINCQASFLDNQTKNIFETSNYYLFKQKKIDVISNLYDNDLSFISLSKEGWENKLELILNVMENLYNHSNNIFENHSNNGFIDIDGENRFVDKNELIDALKNFDTLKISFMEGYEALKNNNNAILAFKYMNEVFNNYYMNKFGSDYNNEKPPSWRLFQLVFIVSAIRSIVDGKDLDTVDVLHVATGGGKSESYFGLIVFSIFYERLNGKPDGVTAIVKFPLRMLSIQQLERLSSLIIYADKLRKEKNSIFRGSEISLGYYVGNSEDFPGLYSQVKAELYEDEKFTKLKQYPVYSKIITSCPLCDSNNRGRVKIIDEPEKKRVIHQCEGNKEHIFYIYYSDREIFRYRPTVIVSTVDKWAGLAQQKRARSLLGASGSMCPDGHGFIASGDKCEDNESEGKCPNIGLNLPSSSGPILSIQDEIHLLKESFGTISSHFEGLIEETIMANSGGKKIKNIAMSATLNGIVPQIEELYKKKTFVISGDPQTELNPSFKLFFKKTEIINRLIYGMIPNLRDNHYATLRTILHAIEFIDKEQRNFIQDRKEWCNKYGMKSENEAIQTFKDFLTILTYHLKKQDSEDMNRFSDVVINEPLKKESNITTRGIVLTGDKGLDELKETIDHIKNKFSEYDIEKQILPNASYEPVFATSVVSHGIDLEELNFMVFQGIPYTTSEYIQALSRVGRSRVGIVMVWLYPNRVRDGSFFRNFKRYHEALDHEVLPTPIKRNSILGIKQTVNSLFCAGIIQFLSNKHGKPLIHKKDIMGLDANDKKELVQFIKSVYGKHINLDIEKEVEMRINQICESSERENTFFPEVLAKSGEYYYRNQSGMRGIQGAIVLKPYSSTRSKLKNMNGGN